MTLAVTVQTKTSHRLYSTVPTVRSLDICRSYAPTIRCSTGSLHHCLRMHAGFAALQQSWHSVESVSSPHLYVVEWWCVVYPWPHRFFSSMALPIQHYLGRFECGHHSFARTYCSAVTNFCAASFAATLPRLRCSLLGFSRWYEHLWHWYFRPQHQMDFDTIFIITAIEPTELACLTQLSFAGRALQSRRRKCFLGRIRFCNTD